MLTGGQKEPFCGAGGTVVGQQCALAREGTEERQHQIWLSHSLSTRGTGEHMLACIIYINTDVIIFKNK